MTVIRHFVAAMIFTLMIYLSLLALDIEAASPVKVGFGQADITPKLYTGESKNVFLPSGAKYNKRAGGILSKLTARAIVFDDGKTKIALCSVDAFGLFRTDVQRIREKIKDIFPDGEKVIVASTHTHSAPDTTGIYSDTRRDKKQLEYIDFLVSQTAGAIEEAYNARQPAIFQAAMPRIGNLIKNDRHPEFLDDYTLMLYMENLDSHRGNLLENFAASFLGREKIKPVVLANMACHPEFMRKTNLISNDFVGGFRMWLEFWAKSRDGVANAVFFNGALGGMVVANTPELKDPQLRMIRFNNLLMERLRINASQRFKPIDISGIRIYTKVFLTKLDNGLFEQRLGQGLLPQKLKDGRLEVEVSLIELGEKLVFVTIPGELSPEISIQIRKLFPRKYVGILGLANDELGYILPRRRYKEKIHRYERHLAINEKIGNQIFDAVKNLARESQKEDKQGTGK